MSICCNCKAAPRRLKSAYCAPCRDARTQAWKATHRDSLNATQRARYAADPETHRRSVAEWRERNPEKAARSVQSWRLRNPHKWAEIRYGITKGTVPVRPALCDVCCSSEKLTVDHDHVTGAFRGWLCNGCNNALGRVRDNANVLERLALYLRVRR